MIVCKDCGSQESDSTTFCGACGSFLEWHGEHLAESPGDPGFDIDDAEEMRRRGIVATVKEALGLDHEEQARLAEEAARKEEAAAERRQAYEAASIADAHAQARTEAEMAARAAADAEQRAKERAELAAQAEAQAAEAAAQAAEAQARAAEQAQAGVNTKLEATRRAAQAGDEEARRAAEAQARAAEVAAAQARAQEEAEAQARADAELRRQIEAEAAERAAAAAAVEAEAKRQAEARAAAAAAEEAKARAESEERLRRAAALVAPKAPVTPAVRPGTPAKAGAGGQSAAVPGAAAGPGAGSIAPAPQASLPGPQVIPLAGDVPAGGFSAPTSAGLTGTGNAQPEAVLPGMAERRARAVRTGPPPRRPEPGDLICGQCGAFNDPARKFCRHCGNSLAEAATVKMSWWRRLVGWFRGWRQRRKVRALGARPSARAGGTTGAGGPAIGMSRARHAWLTWKRWIKRGLALAVLAVVILALVPGTNPIKTERQKLFGEVKALNGKAVLVYPSSAVATSQLPGHTATDAINLSNNISWYSAPSPSGGVGQAITVSFPTPTPIDRIGVIPGAYQAAFDVYSRPFGIKLSFIDPTGKTVATDEYKLGDSASFQPIPEKVTNVSKVVVQVLSVYRGAGDNGVAIASLQFFRIEHP
jgi:hypothetical protein